LALDGVARELPFTVRDAEASVMGVSFEVDSAAAVRAVLQRGMPKAA